MQVNWEKFKPAPWDAVGGAVALAIIGFAWGGPARTVRPGRQRLLSAR